MFTLFNLQGTLETVFVRFSFTVWLHREIPRPKQLFDYITQFSVCQELFSSFFKLFCVIRGLIGLPQSAPL